MHPDEWQQVKKIVDRALGLPEENRGAFLAAVDDETVRQAAKDLLNVPSARADAFDRLHLFPTAHNLQFKAGDTVGPYTILDAIDRGGMGAVYKARDGRQGRTVALKILNPAVLAVSRNEDEAQARLTHKYIATLYDSDTTPEGFHYVSMEYVEGVPITAFCHRRCPTLRSRLELFRKVCEAVQYAHQQLVVHRDLKPDNILVTAAGEPKLLDFGIAKILPSDPALLTLTHSAERPFTLAFASPEQLGGEYTDTRTDIYSLGVLLSLLLTGHLPYKLESAHDLPEAIRKLEPIRPSALVSFPSLNSSDDIALEKSPQRLRRLLEGDLDAIALRALRKEPDRRYRTVDELSEDVRRYISHEPVAARRGTWRYRTAKFIKRHALVLAITSLASATLLILSGSWFVQYRRAVRGEKSALVQAERTRQVNRFIVDLFRRTDPFSPTSSPDASVDQLLDQSTRVVEATSNDNASFKAPFLSVLGEIFNDRGDPQRAQRLLESAIALQKRQPKDQAFAETLYRYGILLTAQGHYPEAENQLKHAEEVLLTLGRGKDPIFEARIEISRAANKVQQADYVSAQKFLEAALSHIGNRPEASYELSLALLGLGRLLDAKDHDKEAEALYRRALSLARRPKGPDSAYVAIIENTLGTLLLERGDYSGAQVLLSHALVTEQNIFGADGLINAVTIHNLASLESKRGNLQGALARYQRAEAILSRHYSPKHLRVIMTRNQIADTLIQLNDYERGKKVLLETLQIERETLPKVHPVRGVTVNDLAFVYQYEGNLRQSRILYSESLATFVALVGRNNRAVASILSNLASIAQCENDDRTAERLYREALDITRSLDQGKNSGNIIALVNLASFYLSRNDVQRAGPLLHEASSIAGVVVGPTDWLTGYVESWEAELLRKQGSISNAVAKAEHARAIVSAKVPSNDWRAAVTESILGAALGRNSQPIEAEPLLLGALAKLRVVKGEISIYTQDAIERVHTFYRDQGRPRDASKYKRHIGRE